MFAARTLRTSAAVLAALVAAGTIGTAPAMAGKPPPAPTGLTASATAHADGSYDVSATWNAVASATSYRVSLTKGGTTLSSTTVTTTSWAPTVSTTPGTASVSVRAVVGAQARQDRDEVGRAPRRHDAPGVVLVVVDQHHRRGDDHPGLADRQQPGLRRDAEGRLERRVARRELDHRNDPEPHLPAHREALRAHGHPRGRGAQPERGRRARSRDQGRRGADRDLLGLARDGLGHLHLGDGHPGGRPRRQLVAGRQDHALSQLGGRNPPGDLDRRRHAVARVRDGGQLHTRRHDHRRGGQSRPTSRPPPSW